MENLDAVQPLDEYVRRILEKVAKEHNLNIDLDNPTRSQRLEAALAIKDVANGWYSMEIMVGRKVLTEDPFANVWASLKMAETLGPADPRRFYANFGHQYWPKKKHKKKL